MTAIKKYALAWFKAIVWVAFFAFEPAIAQRVDSLRQLFPTTGGYPHKEWEAFEKLATEVLTQPKHPIDSLDYYRELFSYHSLNNNTLEARDALNLVLRTAERLGDSAELADSHLNMANFLVRLGDTKNAEFYMNKAKAYYTNIPWGYEQGYFFTSLSSFYDYIGELDSAILISNQTLNRIEQDTSGRLEGLKRTNIHLLSLIYFKQQSYDSTFKYAKLYYDLSKALNDIKEMPDAANNMAVYYSYVLEDDAQAEKYLREAVKAHGENNDFLDLANTLKNLSYTLYNLERYDEAFDVLDSSILISDSITEAIQLREIIRLEREFNYERESQEKLLAQQDAEEAKVYTQLLGALVLILGLAATLGFVLVRTKSKERQRQLELKDARISSLLKATELEALNAELEGQNKERKRIAQELHDRLGSLLAGTKMQFTAFASKVNDEEKQAQIEELLKEAMAEVRNVSHNLYNPKLLNDGLPASIKRLCETVNHQGLSAEFTLTDNLPPMSNELKSNVFKIFQELLTNILKHANASSIRVSLAFEENDLVMRVSDNGKGFDISNFTGGLGLNNIQERAELIGGSIEIDSSPGKGTVSTLRVTL
jgi:signal transduction histidine kinase